MTPLLPHVAPCLLVAVRIGGLMIYGPVFGSSVVPARVKVLLTFVIAVAVYPVLAATVLPPPGTIELAVWSLAPLVAAELLVGLCIGFLASLPLMAVQTGGLVMGQQMGLGFASFFNPAIDDEADVVGQMLFLMALVGFLMLGGHEAMLVAVLRSFEHVPAGVFVADTDLLGLVAGLLGSAFELALRIAAPLLALIFLESAAMGLVAKTVPQLNILSLGFPVRILAGMLIVMLALNVIDEVVMDDVEAVLDTILRWIESGPGVGGIA